MQRVQDMDELATTLIMFAQPHPVAAGSLVSIHDSGGERQLLIDLAADMEVPLAEIEPKTEARLAELLDPGLPPVNPLDAWGAGGPDADEVMEDCLAALMSDPNAAMGAVVHDRGPLSCWYESYFEYMRVAHRASGKPAFLVSNRQGSGTDPKAVAVTREGFPVLDGVRSFLAGTRCLFNYRDFKTRQAASLPAPDPDIVAHWQSRLASGNTLEEYEVRPAAGRLWISRKSCGTCGIRGRTAHAADQFEYPLVLKTAEPGILHKTDRGGVVLNIENQDQLLAAYADLSDPPGPCGDGVPDAAGQRSRNGSGPGSR